MERRGEKITPTPAFLAFEPRPNSLSASYSFVTNTLYSTTVTVSSPKFSQRFRLSPVTEDPNVTKVTVSEVKLSSTSGKTTITVMETTKIVTSKA